MNKQQFDLLKHRRFLPLFISQFAEAFNDNLLKNAMVVLIAYRLSTSPQSNVMLMALAGAIFILPFFLFSALAGQLADSMNKARLIQIVKVFEVIFVTLGAVGFYTGNSHLLFITLFFMGSHSAFFGPAKYSILPDHLSENELIAGNAFLESSTFLSILLGNVIGGVFILHEHGIFVVSILMGIVALISLGSSFFIPSTPIADPNTRINLNIFKSTYDIIQDGKADRVIFIAILGCSWFWLIGSALLSQVPSLAKDIFQAHSTVETLFIALFAIGIGVGSLLCNRLLNGEVSAKFVPFSIIGMTLFMLDIVFSCRHLSALPVASPDALIGLSAFLKNSLHWRVSFDLFAIAICGGLYIVPLNALIQTEAKLATRSKVIAANNVMNAAFMVGGAIIVFALSLLHFSLLSIILVLGLMNAFVAVYVCMLLPDAVVKSFVKWLLVLLYDVNVTGLDNYKKAIQKNALLIANHTSLLDIVLLSAFLPDRFMVAVNSTIAKKWWLKPLLKLVEAFPIDPTSPMATKSIIKEIKKGKHCIIFPEGRITVTGTLMKVYEGPGLIAAKSGAAILPVRIEGAQYTLFSRMKHKVRTRWFPKINIHILPEVTLPEQPTLTKRQIRQRYGTTLYTVMSNMLFESSPYHNTIFQAVLNARKIFGGKFTVVEDADRKPLNYHQLIARAFILGQAMANQTERREQVGILLPTTVTGVLSFYALHAFGRIPAMLNFSAGISNVLSACELGQIKTVYTAHKFVEIAKIEDLVAALEQKVRVVYLEDFKNTVGLPQKLKGLFIGRFMAERAYKKYAEKWVPTEKAVILFTSGSEGKPKGVALSHENILANCYQMQARVDFTSKDVMFNALPIFHCFGLTVGSILPVISGMRAFFYPNPLHYRVVPELVYDTNATIMFGTNTFLMGYARSAHQYDFYSIRYIFAGAEKLKLETSQLYAEKFGVRLYEGYGATETAPVVATNTPMQFKLGTVGNPMPGMQCKLDPVPGITEGGRLQLKGPNVMMGYIDPNNPNELIALKEGWYDTGDICSLDNEGFIHILGRAKRFAKIGGEMVSLTAIESALTNLWPESLHAIAAVPDAKKGEQLILLTNYADADRESIIAYVKQRGMSELTIPKKILYIPEMPVLASGKLDYVGVQQTAENKLKITVAETGQ